LIVLLASEPATAFVPGDAITYTIRYTNTTLAPMRDLTLVSTLPVGMELLPTSLSAPAIALVQEEEQTLHWTMKELAPQSAGFLRYRVQRPAAAALPLATIVQLQLKAPLTATAGVPFTYTLQLTNTRPFPLRNLVVNNPLPAGVTVVHAGGGSVMDDQIQWTLRQLPALRTATFAWQATATQSILTAGAWAQLEGGPASTGNRVLTMIDDKVPPTGLVPVYHTAVQFTWQGEAQTSTLHTQALEQWMLP